MSFGKIDIQPTLLGWYIFGGHIDGRPFDTGSVAAVRMKSRKIVFIIAGQRFEKFRDRL